MSTGLAVALELVSSSVYLKFRSSNASSLGLVLTKKGNNAVALAAYQIFSSFIQMCTSCPAVAKIRMSHPEPLGRDKHIQMQFDPLLWTPVLGWAVCASATSQIFLLTITGA